MSFWSQEVFDEAEKDSGTFEALPEGNYVAAVTETTIKETKSGGHMLKLKLEIVGPTHAGRVVFDNINVDNSNVVAVQIGLGTLKQIAEAAGNLPWYEKLKTCPSWQAAETHLETLHNVCAGKLFAIRLGIEKDKTGTYDPSNKVKRYSANGNSPGAAEPAAKKKPF